MSDESPCSVPHFLRPLVPVEHAAWQHCCRAHDDDYRRGGTELDRLIADVKFFLSMLTSGVDPAWAEAYYIAVRTYGRLSFGTGNPIPWPPQPPQVEAP